MCGPVAFDRAPHDTVTLGCARVALYLPVPMTRFANLASVYQRRVHYSPSVQSIDEPPSASQYISSVYFPLYIWRRIASMKGKPFSLAGREKSWRVLGVLGTLIVKVLSARPLTRRRGETITLRFVQVFASFSADYAGGKGPLGAKPSGYSAS